MALVRGRSSLVRVELKFSATYSTRVPKTGVVLMNLGGPETTQDVRPFLQRLFADGDLIPLGRFQRQLSQFIAWRRTPAIQKQYTAIGGGSPIKSWTEAQGAALCARLDKMCPKSAPHKHYIAFRYAEPLTDQALDAMQADGIKQAVAFTQYPQFSCSTTGSSLIELQRCLERRGINNIEWSVIDRWHSHPRLVEAFAESISDTLQTYAPAERDGVVLLFSAHSLPLSVVGRGDPYPYEVAATVHAVMAKLGNHNPFRLVWQSKVGPSKWLSPSTDQALKGMAAQGKKNVMLIPIAFTSDHIETLYELDQEYGEEAHKLGITGLTRCESMNARPTFLTALSEVVAEHLASGQACSAQYMLRCPGCTNPKCAHSKAYFGRTAPVLRPGEPHTQSL